MLNIEIEKRKKILCDAVNKLLIVKLKYGEDKIHWRTYEPQAVFTSTADNIDVTGIQTKDSAKPFDVKRKVRNFTLSKITALEITDDHFQYDPTFDPRHKRFANGIFCCIKPPKIG